ncbi:MAG: hypothetical protein ACOC1O_03575 [bacterium]
MEGFEGLTSAFNINDEEKLEKNIEKVEKDIKTIESKKELVKARADNLAVFGDQEWIRTELKTLIMSARTVMAKVEEDMKIGMGDRRIEVYAKLLESIGRQYSQLLELNKSIFDAQVKSGKVDIENIGDNKISLSSDQLLDMINKASERSQLNSIDAEFEIKEENIPEDKGGE